MSLIFTPTGPTVSISAPAATSESVALGAFSGTAGAVVRVFNASDKDQHVAFGAGSATATTASLPLGIGAVEYVEVPPNITHAAVIESAASLGTIYFTPGQAR